MAHFKCVEFKQRGLTRATNGGLYTLQCVIQTITGVVLWAAHRNQANSHPCCGERKTLLLLLRVRDRMGRVLFIQNMTCLYSE